MAPRYDNTKAMNMVKTHSEKTLRVCIKSFMRELKNLTDSQKTLMNVFQGQQVMQYKDIILIGILNNYLIELIMLKKKLGIGSS